MTLSQHPLQSSPGLTRLNDDCLAAAFEYLDAASVMRASQVSRWCRGVALSTPRLWRELSWTEALVGVGCIDKCCKKQLPAREASRNAFRTLLSRSGETDLRLTFTLLPAPARHRNNTENALPVIKEMYNTLHALRMRIIDLTLDIRVPDVLERLAGTDVSPLLDMPRVSNINLCRTNPRALPRTTATPLLRSLSYIGDTACAFWVAERPNAAIRSLEIQAVVPRGWACPPPTRGSPWLDPILRVFPALEELRVWESIQDQNDWQSHGHATEQLAESQDQTPPPLRRLDIRRLAFANPWTPESVARLDVHQHVGLHGIQQPSEFAYLLQPNETILADIHTLRISARPSSRTNSQYPFAIGPDGHTVYSVAVEFSDNRSRSITTLNRNCAGICIQTALEAAMSSCSKGIHLVVDGFTGWELLFKYADARQLALVTSTTMLASSADEPAQLLSSGLPRTIPSLRTFEILPSHLSTPHRVDEASASLVRAKMLPSHSLCTVSA